VTGRRFPVTEHPRRPGDPPSLVAAADNARTALGWLPKHTDIVEMVADAWAFRTR
jgi:UDP-glucose 4-epimerase